MNVNRLKIALTLLALVTAGLACNRTSDTNNPVRSISNPLPAPVSISALLDNGSVSLSWEVLDTAKVRNFRIYLCDSDGKNAHLRDTTVGADFSQTITGLQTNQSYWFSVASVDLQGIEGSRSTPFGVTAAVVSILINGGSEYTNSRNVTISVNAPSNTTHVMLSESSAMTGAQFQPFQSQKSFHLTDGDGLKHVYAKFLYSDGSQSGVPVSDSITLDTRAAIDSVFFTPTSGSFSSGSVIIFEIDAGEPDGSASVSFPGSPTITLADDGVAPDAVAHDGIYTGRFVVPSDISVVNGSVVGSFTDGAGNQATPVSSAQLITITNNPNPVAFTFVSALSSSSVSLVWTVATGTDFSAYRLFRSLSRTVSDTSTLVAAVTDKNQTSVTDTALEENSKYFYRIYVYNSTGNKAASPVDSVKTMVNIPPQAVVLAATSTDTVNVKLTWSQNADADFAYYRLYRSVDTTAAVDTTSELVTIAGSQSTTSYSDIFPRNASACAYRVYVYDKQGKSTPSNKAIARK